MKVNGWLDARFSDVREVFAEVLDAQPGTGASFAAWHDGRWVVDLWGGFADAARTRPWRSDTLVMPYSVTKPFAALCVLKLVERGAVDLDAPMQRYWPDLRAAASVREVLAHRAGVVALDADAPQGAFYDWELMCSLLARQEPSWVPGAATGESALFFGHLLGQVVRAVDGRPLGAFLREEICGPLDLDFHIGVADRDLARVADLTGFGDDFWAAQSGYPPLFERAIGNPPGARDPDVVNSRRWRQAEIPAVNGHGTARSVAGFYAALAHGRIVDPALVGELTRGRGEEPDLVVGGNREWGLGVALDQDGYGMGGTGGSFGWWSQAGQYAIAFLTGHIGDHDRGDRLEAAVREVLGLPAL
ncbi:serine hydrolase domain-containing protein [Kribbia dieselivorans]|uniref:serine hydrolase domain-containing protein n=1 Tax=Kribbia dieselivorans TaxID=331526 RepID=UPI000B22F82E|nr:serine hydrolase domain-containing protein [Kribbia dieselivorans]